MYLYETEQLDFFGRYEYNSSGTVSRARYTDCLKLGSQVVGVDDLSGGSGKIFHQGWTFGKVV
jgi:hypothetical protein